MRISRGVEIKIEIPKELVIVIDTREKEPLFSWLSSEQRVVKKLDYGDYSILGFEKRIAVERKTQSDLWISLTKERDRFEKELEGLRGYEFIGLVVESREEDLYGYQLFSNTSPNVIYNSIASIEVKYNLHIYITPSREMIEKWVLSRFKFYYKYKRLKEI